MGEPQAPPLYFISTKTLVTRRIRESQTELRKIIGFGEFLPSEQKLTLILVDCITFLFLVQSEQRWHIPFDIGCYSE